MPPGTDQSQRLPSPSSETAGCERGCCIQCVRLGQPHPSKRLGEYLTVQQTVNAKPHTLQRNAPEDVFQQPRGGNAKRSAKQHTHDGQKAKLRDDLWAVMQHALQRMLWEYV